MAKRVGSMAVGAALGMCLLACQRDERPSAAAESAARANVEQAAARKQAVIDFAQTLKDRMAQCAGDQAPPHAANPRLLAAAWAAVERDKEANCTKLMTDLGSGGVFPPNWPEDQRAKFRRALNTYGKYAAQFMSRSQNEAMFMESVQDDQDAVGEMERYTKAIGVQSAAFRDRGEKLFRQAAKEYGVGDADLRLPDS